MKKFSLLAIICLSILFSCKKDEDPITYQVYCDPYNFSVTYKDVAGNTIQEDVIGGSWVKVLDYNEDMTDAYLEVQAAKPRTTVKLSIKQGDKVIQEATKTGDFVVSIVSGRLK